MTSILMLDMTVREQYALRPSVCVFSRVGWPRFLWFGLMMMTAMNPKSRIGSSCERILLLIAVIIQYLQADSCFRILKSCTFKQGICVTNLRRRKFPTGFHLPCAKRLGKRENRGDFLLDVCYKPREKENFRGFITHTLFFGF